MIRLVAQSQKLKEWKWRNSKDYGLASNECFLVFFFVCFLLWNHFSHTTISYMTKSIFTLFEQNHKETLNKTWFKSDLYSLKISHTAGRWAEGLGARGNTAYIGSPRNVCLEHKVLLSGRGRVQSQIHG